ncbi:hypothetical protein SAMN05660209_05005 [Geodermatophilus africanus]|uniref:Uncharacterized protein n=1 Tax=Geodermatophilus africanus TaxID=1137993 RepID=A0A1H3R2R3_9ACTN|nr:hypothetical protein SAMN05660209_05005 [Geodermatophilus africanus]
MGAAIRQLFAVGNGDATATVTMDLGSPQTFLAWGAITWIDSTATFDRDNAVGIDITHVDGVRTGTALQGGDHLGDPGALKNLHQGAVFRFGRTVTFRLRAFHGEDLNALGYGIAITNP